MLIKATKAYHALRTREAHDCVNAERVARILVLAVAASLSLAACSEPTPPARQAPASEVAPASPSPEPAKSNATLIREGVGVGGVELGMTAAEVEARLGKPDHVNKAGSETVFMAFREPDNFGVYFGDADRVRMLIVSIKDGSACTDYGACLYREGDLAKLKARHGDKLLRYVDRDGSVTYRLLEAKGDRHVMTEYTPAEDRNGVVQVAILYWTGPIDKSSFD